MLYNQWLKKTIYLVNYFFYMKYKSVNLNYKL